MIVTRLQTFAGWQERPCMPVDTAAAWSGRDLLKVMGTTQGTPFTVSKPMTACEAHAAGGTIA